MGTGDKDCPEALLAGMDTALADLVISAAAVLPEEEGPFQPPLLAPAHRSCSGGFFCWALSGGLRSPHSRLASASRSRMEGALLRGAPMRFALGLLLLLTFAAVVQHPVDHPVVVLQGHLGGANTRSSAAGRAMICPFRLMNCSGCLKCSVYFCTCSGVREVKLSSLSPTTRKVPAMMS